MKTPLCIDLFCGMFGWSAGWLELGGRVIGFDLDHQPHHGPIPSGASLVIQDVLTLHGRQFKDASLILASPPCQEFSFMAMPWSRAKQKAREYRDGTRDVRQLTALFEACFRIQREAQEASGRFIPLVVENVRGAQPYVGRAKFHFGSFYLWGDVPALMPIKKASMGFKVPSLVGRRTDVGAGARFTSRDCDDGVKQGGDWFNTSQPYIARLSGSKSSARKAASAQIAKIPLTLSRWIGMVYYPHEKESNQRRPDIQSMDRRQGSEAAEEASSDALPL